MKSLGHQSRATTLRRTIFAILLVLLSLQLVAFGRLMLASWDHFQQSNDLIALNDVVRDYLRAADSLDKERALTLALLSRNSPPSETELHRMTNWRSDTEHSLQQARTRSSRLERIMAPGMLMRIEDAHQQLQRMRKEVDQYLSRDTHAPDQSLSYATTLAQARELDSISDFVIELTRKLQISDNPSLNRLTNLKVYLWLVRRSISNQAAGLVARAELARPLNSSAEQDIQRSKAQGETYMDRLNGEARQLKAPELIPPLQDMTRMFDRLAAMTQTQLDEMRTLSPLSLSGDAARQELETDLSLISDTAQLVADRAEVAISEHRSHVVMQLVKDGSLGILSLALSLSLLWMIKNRILRPLRALEAVQDAASEAILILDGESHIVMSNQGAQRLFNLSAEELQGQLIQSLVDLEGEHAHLTGWAAAPFTFRTEISAIAKPPDLPPFFVRVSISPMNQRGLTHTALVTIRDDHLRHLAEQENQRSLSLMAAIAAVEQSIILRNDPIPALQSLFGILTDYLYARSGVLQQTSQDHHGKLRASIVCIHGEVDDIPLDTLQSDEVLHAILANAPTAQPVRQDSWMAIPVRLGKTLIAIAWLYQPDDRYIRSVLEPWSAAYSGIISFMAGEEQRQASDRQMRRAVQEQQLIFSASPVGLLQISPQFGIVHANEAAEAIFGAKPQQLDQRHLFELLCDEEGCNQLARLLSEQVTEPRSHNTCEVTCQTEDGRSIWVLFELRPLMDHGRLSGAIVACLDTTERKQNELALREARDHAAEARHQLTSAIESISEGFVFFDLSDRVVLCNQRYADMFASNKTAAELIGYDFSDIVRLAVQNGEVIEAGFDEAGWIRERISRHHTFESAFQLQIGERWYQVNDRLILGLGYAGILTDITDFKDREQQLENARNQADSANRAKSAFLAAMSHEIRTPMNGVLGMLELLSLSRLDHEQQDTVSTIQDSARSLLRLIDDILDFSKIEAGKLDLNPEPAALRDIVASVKELFREVASGKGLWFNGWVAPDVAEAVMIDPLRLRQILHNFLSNAIKFTPAGSVELTVSVLETQPGRQTLQFAISDTGIGIAPENISRLMQPFTQAESDTTRRFGGTGLGLAISKRLAEMMGGDIRLDSEPDHGTTATLEVTVDTLDPALLPGKPDPAQHRPALANAIAPRDMAPVLFVEDNPTNRKLTLKQLELLGVPFVVAEDGRQALERWNERDYSLVLTDCHMPYVNGYQLAEAIRSDEALRGIDTPIPIVACTANAAREETERSFAAGMNDILTKPLGLDALRQMIDKWLGPPPANAAEVAESSPNETLSTSADVVDRSILAVYSSGDLAIECEIVRDFLNCNAEDMQELQNGIEAKLPERIAWFAHRIKGAGRMVGAREVGEAAEALEFAGKAGQHEVSALKDRLDSAVEALDAWCSRQAC